MSKETYLVRRKTLKNLFLAMREIQEEIKNQDGEKNV